MFTEYTQKINPGNTPSVSDSPLGASLGVLNVKIDDLTVEIEKLTKRLDLAIK